MVQEVLLLGLSNLDNHHALFGGCTNNEVRFCGSLKSFKVTYRIEDDAGFPGLASTLMLRGVPAASAMCCDCVCGEKKKMRKHNSEGWIRCGKRFYSRRLGEGRVMRNGGGCSDVCFSMKLSQQEENHQSRVAR
jgi:hypothetical protein